MNKFLTNLFIIGGVALAVSSCSSSSRFSLDTDFDSSPTKSKTNMTEALQCLGRELEKNLANPGAYAFMVRDIADGTVNIGSNGPLADAGRLQMISILTAYTKPSHGLVMDRFPLLFSQTNNEQIGINRFGLPSAENLNTYLSMLTNLANANRQSQGMPMVKSVMPLIIDGAFTRYDSSHTRSKGYGQNAGYRGSSEDEQSASIDRGKSGSERSITLVVNIIDPKTNTIVGTEGFDLKFYSNSKTARFRVAVDDLYYGFSNTDVRVETVHAAQQILLEAGAIWILDNAFGSMVDFSLCFDTDEKLALGRDSRYQQSGKLLPTAVAAQQLNVPAPLPAVSIPVPTPAPAPLSEALPEQDADATRIAQTAQAETEAAESQTLATAKQLVNADGTYWQVVVGIFARSKNVAAVSRQLDAAGYKPNYSVAPGNSGKATQIWLGPYTTKELAKETSANLEKIIGAKGYVSKQTF